MPKEKVEKPQPKPLDKEDYNTRMSAIIDQLTVMASSREVITVIVNHLYSEYGLKKPIVRKAATALFKQVKKEQMEELNQEVINLMEQFKE